MHVSFFSFQILSFEHQNHLLLHFIQPRLVLDCAAPLCFSTFVSHKNNIRTQSDNRFPCQILCHFQSFFELFFLIFLNYCSFLVSVRHSPAIYHSYYDVAKWKIWGDAFNFPLKCVHVYIISFFHIHFICSCTLCQLFFCFIHRLRSHESKQIHTLTYQQQIQRIYLVELAQNQ